MIIKLKVFNDTTIFFCDIVGFTNIASDSTANQIIALAFGSKETGPVLLTPTREPTYLTQAVLLEMATKHSAAGLGFTAQALDETWTDVQAYGAKVEPAMQTASKIQELMGIAIEKQQQSAAYVVNNDEVI